MSNVFFLFLLQIDSSIFGEIDDATMASYIPAYGDRIATRRFCMEKQRRGGDDTKRLSLFKKLQQKMGTMSNKDSNQGFEVENTVQPTKMWQKNNESLEDNQRNRIRVDT